MTGVFFCLGATACLIRLLLLAMIKPLALLYPGRDNRVVGCGAREGQAGSSMRNNNNANNSYSLFGSTSSTTTSPLTRSPPPQQQQQLPGCARPVPPSPRGHTQQQHYGPPVSYADAVSHSSTSNVDVASSSTVAGGSSKGVQGSSVLRSPTSGGSGGVGVVGGSSPSGRGVRFADEA